MLGVNFVIVGFTVDATRNSKIEEFSLATAISVGIPSKRLTVMSSYKLPEWLTNNDSTRW